VDCPKFVAAAQSHADAQQFNSARAHAPGTRHNSPCGRPAHAAAPHAPLCLHGHFGQLSIARISVLRFYLQCCVYYCST
jgi:hypothetical protein